MEEIAPARQPFALSPALIVGAALIVVVIVTTIAAIDVKPFWLDEAYTGAAMLSDSMRAMLNTWVRHDVQTPVYYALLYMWTRLFGLSDVALRLPSLLCYLATIVVMAMAGRKIVGGRASMTWALAFACSSLSLHYALEARVYALLMLLSAAAAIAFVAVRQHDSLRRVAVFTICATVLAATHYFGMLLAGAFYIRLLWLALGKREMWARWGASGFVAASVVALLLEWQLPSLLAKSGGNFWIPEMSFWTAIVISVSASCGGPLGLLLWVAFPTVLSRKVVAEMSRKTISPTYFANELLIITMASICVVLLVSLQTPLIVPRYFSVFVPPILLAGALRLTCQPWSSNTAWFAPGFAAISLLSAQPWQKLNPKPNPLDWSQASDILRREGVRDVVFVLDDPVAPALGPDVVAELGRFFFARVGYSINIHPRLSRNSGGIPLGELPPDRFGVIKVNAGMSGYTVDQGWMVRLLDLRDGTCSSETKLSQTCLIDAVSHHRVDERANLHH